MNRFFLYQAPQSYNNLNFPAPDILVELVQFLPCGLLDSNGLFDDFVASLSAILGKSSHLNDCIFSLDDFQSRFHQFCTTFMLLIVRVPCARHPTLNVFPRVYLEAYLLARSLPGQDSEQVLPWQTNSVPARSETLL